MTPPAEAASGAGLANLVPIVMKAPAPSPLPETERAERHPEAVTDGGVAPGIEIRLAGAVVRVSAGTDPTLLSEVLRAVQALAR